MLTVKSLNWEGKKMDYHIDLDVHVIGFKPMEYIHIAITEAGKNKIPFFCIINNRPNIHTGMIEVIIPTTIANVLALRLGNYITNNDAKKILNKP